MAYFSSVPLTVKPFVPVRIKADWLVLHWGNAHKMLYKSGGACWWMHGQSDLQTNCLQLQLEQ